MIFAKPQGDARTCLGVMSVAVGPDPRDILGFSEVDKEGTFQPHDDALVVTIGIDGYDVKRVLVD